MFDHSGLGSAVVPLGKRAMMGMHEGMKGHMSGHMNGHGMATASDEPDGSPTPQLPHWVPVVYLALFVVFMPLMLFISYTLNSLLPTLAMIEDPSPPAYEPLSTDAEDSAAPAPSKPRLVTSSIRQTSRMLRGISGFASLFRGFWCAFFVGIIMSMAHGFFEAFIPNRWLSAFLSPLAAIMATLPLTTAWTHVVMSAPTSTPWYRRIPSLRKSFSALWRPALISWGAVASTTTITEGLFELLGAPADFVDDDPNYHAAAWKTAVAFIVGIVLGLCLVVPAHIIMTRIQASLLPVEDEPIVSFDRSFSGRVEPEVVGGKGYASIADAWHSFSKDQWLRLIKLYAKIVAISLVVLFVFGAVVFSVLLAARHQIQAAVMSQLEAAAAAGSNN